jgi:hypothetical protein
MVGQKELRCEMHLAGHRWGSSFSARLLSKRWLPFFDGGNSVALAGETDCQVGKVSPTGTVAAGQRRMRRMRMSER